jgi:hypothetical protein
MIQHNLWPTVVYQTNIGLDKCLEIRAQLAAYEAQDIPPEDMPRQEIFGPLLEDFKDIGTFDIINTWAREVEPNGKDNNFEIHCDTHHHADYIAVVWLDGEEDCGGDLMLYDPAWRNPRNPRDFDKDSRHAYRHSVKFKVGEVIMFPACVWHSVTSYTGTRTRVGLNLAVNIDGTNN